MRGRTWSAPIVEWLDCNELALPELVEPGSLIGEISAEASQATGLRQGLPLIAGAGDGQAAGVGAGIAGPGEAYLNLGTAIVSGVLSDAYHVDRAFRTLFAAQPDAYFLETDLKGGTFTLNWLTETLLGVPASEQRARLAALQSRAEGLPPGSDGLLLVPYWCAVMNPYWDDAATGVLVGLHGAHDAAHVYRAVLEGIAFEQRLHSEGVEAATDTRIERFVVMGGGAHSDLWCQILADVLNRPIVRCQGNEATALGAAVLASAGLGLYSTLADAARSMTGRGKSFEPGEQQPQFDALYRDVYRTLYPALSSSMARLAELRASAHRS
jgi:xylulokinase